MNTMGLFFMPCPMAGLTRVFDFLSAPMADITSDLTTHHAKWSLRVHIDDTRSVTTTTSYWASSWFRTRTVTSMASRLTIVFNFFICTKNRFFKLKVDPILQIIPLTRCVGIATCTTSTKEARENIFKATKARTVKATKTASSTAEASISTRSTILIIGCPFLLITQGFISLLDFFVFLFSTRFFIDVWMIFF